ncbi:iron-siderophore ABC transporter substrate-binding protein [Spiractinospora alimapuensis]|uniref:ABC transporter substrate-binding protein n=1 Tax=Spiractinospora alimapuensis TaxID=2820884 RepID=UPI001F2609DF|nr:iron-siderophore ABC transporter substrate-binding protein [Spiractinospora alimapuensis]QVQ51540.1 iron-siderophore ABC transporter substrate-binding protein [Spiractinospora alimapuensis]
MRRWIVLLAAVVLPVTACGGGDSEDTAGDGETRTVEHALGETEIPVEPENVVTLWSSTLSAALSLGVEPAGYAFNEDPIEGVDVPEGYDLEAIDYLGHSLELDLERIAGAGPDLILATDVHEESYDQLSEIAPTVVLDWGGTGAWKDHLTDVADVLNATDAAEEVVAEYDDRVAEVAEAIGEPAEVEVSIVRFHAEELRLEVLNSFAGDIAQDVGLARPEVQDVEEEGSGYLPVSLERLPDADGDALFAFTVADNDDEAPNLLEDARDNPLWDELDAVREDNVHTVDYMKWISANYIGAHGVLDDLEEALG